MKSNDRMQMKNINRKNRNPRLPVVGGLGFLLFLYRTALCRAIKQNTASGQGSIVQKTAWIITRFFLYNKISGREVIPLRFGAARCSGQTDGTAKLKRKG
nr:hypothetical protein [uncultured Agathobaculum sp.]